MMEEEKLTQIIDYILNKLDLDKCKDKLGRCIDDIIENENAAKRMIDEFESMNKNRFLYDRIMVHDFTYVIADFNISNPSELARIYVDEVIYHCNFVADEYESDFDECIKEQIDDEKRFFEIVYRLYDYGKEEIELLKKLIETFGLKEYYQQLRNEIKREIKEEIS